MMAHFLSVLIRVSRPFTVCSIPQTPVVYNGGSIDKINPVLSTLWSHNSRLIFASGGRKKAAALTAAAF